EPVALRAYEEARVKRANATVRAARRLGDMAQASSAAGGWLRNRAAALLPQGALIRQLTASWSLPSDY
ncbi:MAG: 2-polyprenyl-6-methoxyphenol hydroxylase, partial [Candidatus Nanopelagicales bacterium]